MWLQDGCIEEATAAENFWATWPVSLLAFSSPVQESAELEAGVIYENGKKVEDMENEEINEILG